jgi:hypothetical protein
MHFHYLFVKPQNEIYHCAAVALNEPKGHLLRIAHWRLFLTFDVPVKLARYQSVAPFLTKIV